TPALYQSSLENSGSKSRRHANAGRRRKKQMSSIRDLESKQDLARAREELAQAKEDLEREKYLTLIYVKARNSQGQLLKQCQANEALIEDAHMNVALFVEAVKDEKFASQFIWETPPAAKTDQRAEERDRAAFTAFVKQNHYGEGVANFNLAREVIGYGLLTQQALIEAVQTGRLRLAPASADELEEREAERIDQEQLRLRNKPSHELKAEAAQSMVDARQQARVEEGQALLR